jgi:lipopolysaccharide/colanic/teichoic acid biosynthesis glycosyltransferase
LCTGKLDDMEHYTKSSFAAGISISLPNERIHATPWNPAALLVKRFLDLMLSSFSLVLLVPLWAVIALAVKLDDGGSVFYVSTRIGRNGMPMRFYKFRTMKAGADKEKRNLFRFNARADGPLFKMKDDPRVTRVGKGLRRSSLDELPQLLNVLSGTMSLVGPRPHLPEEVAAYRNGDHQRLECMPGIVGLPQITGPNTMSFRESVALDLSYKKKWSLALDFWIIIRTIKMVLIDFPRRESPANY